MTLGFIAGAGAVIAGGRRLIGDRDLRRWAVAPVLLTLVLYAIGLVVAALSVDDLLARVWTPPEGATRILWGALAVVLFAALAGVLVLTFVALATALGGPFHERIAKKILGEARIAQRDVGFLRGLVIDVAWAILFAIPAGILGLTALVPGIGPLLAVASVSVAAMGLAVSSAGPALNATGHGLGARFTLLGQRFRFLAGAALVLAAALIVPALGLFAVPAAVIGLTERLAAAGAFSRARSEPA